ncbi:MAG: hypothetical protein U0794_04110 [Isosphaeraceae bacterium]
MLCLSKTTATLAAASLLVFPSLMLRAQPPAPAAAAEKTQDKPKDAPKATSSTDPIERIKDEGMNRSQVMETLSHLTDVIGPRLTGSPALKRANEWTRDTLTKWGMENAHLEAWGPFGRGWTLKRFSAQVVEPQCIPLIGYPKAWSPGTEGPVTGEVVYLDARTDADYAKYKGKLKGAIVLTSAPSEVPSRFEPLASAEPTSSSSTWPTPPNRRPEVSVAAVRVVRRPRSTGQGRDQGCARRAAPSDADRTRMMAEMRSRLRVGRQEGQVRHG